jgi:hypothetical protein
MTTKKTLSKICISATKVALKNKVLMDMVFFLLSAFCFLPSLTRAQEIPSTLFGDYEGDARVVNSIFGIEEIIPGVTVALKSTGDENDYILTIVDFDFYDIDIEMDYVIISPFGEGYKLSRTYPITFIIPEITVPPIPPLLPEGGTFNNVPVKITLENTNIVDFVMDLSMKVVATITIVIIVPIPIDITFDVSFLGELISLPPTPPVILTSKLEEGIVMEEYFVLLEVESDVPVTWSVIDGSLPTGLQLFDTSGLITGIPTKADTFLFTVMATNESGSDTKQLSIIIKEIDTIKIKTPLLASIQIFPNPTAGEFRVSNFEFRIENIDIFDVYGRKAEEDPPSNILEWGNPQAEGVVINISHLQAGIYFVKIKTDSGTVTKKIIKK